ncbi:MAG: patatin-like phospholipase family protein [Acidobacteria bacterium]|nr:patatin-like phospholipase family protein [Acidobacteriota bacterium]
MIRCAVIARAALVVAGLVAAAGAAKGQPCAGGTGLVLAGGGARGGAHVGLLSVMEELRVPVDCIAGTSIGALVGALYAVGYSPAEIEQILRDINWDDLFRDLPERRQLSFRQKEDDRRGLWPVELGIGRSGVSSKAGVIAGSKILMVFRLLTLDAVAAQSFDELRIPFRAVAADLETGEAVVLSAGELATAMRASMSIPGAFTPVTLDGRVLVDGGIADNMPVDVARAMGAGRIIAVDVGTPPRLQERLSPASVLNQTLAVLSERNVSEQRANLRESDLLITPELGRFSAGDFMDIGEAIAIGRHAAQLQQADLRRFSVSEEEYAKFLSRQRRGGELAPREIAIDEVEVRGVPWLRSEVLTERMRTKPGSRLDSKVLQRDLERVNRAGEFETIGFRVEPVGDRNKLIVEAREKSWGPGYLRFGMGFETTFDGDSDFNMLLYYRRARMNRLGAEFKAILSMGDPSALEAEFYQPLVATGTLFVAPRALLHREKDEVYLPSGDFEAVESRLREGGLDVGLNFRNYGELRMGASFGTRSYEPATTSQFAHIESDVGELRLRLALDRIDNVFFPTRGTYTALQATFSRGWLGASDDYDRVQLGTMASTTRGRNTVTGMLRLETDLGSDLPVYQEYSRGGFLDLSGLRRRELRGDVSALVTLMDTVRVGKLGPFGNLYAGIAAQAGNAWPDVDSASLTDLVGSGTLFFGVDNPFTPVYLGYGLAEGGEHAWYLFLGPVLD